MYRKIVLKLSGEALSPGINSRRIQSVCKGITQAVKLKVKVALVIGGGNIFRGKELAGRLFSRNIADYMGMLATVINGLAIQEGLRAMGTDAFLFSALEVPKLSLYWNPEAAKDLWKKKSVLIISGGTGSPFFTTDTAAVLRAAELEAEVVFKGTKVDGVYDKDPLRFERAKRFKFLSFEEAIKKKLKIMDLTAFSLCRGNKIPIIVFDFFKNGNFLKAIKGEAVGTLVSSNRKNF